MEVDVKPYKENTTTQIGFVQISEESKWNDSLEGLKHQKPLKEGFNLVKVPDYQKTTTKSNNFISSLIGGNFNIGFMNRFYQGHTINYALVKCSTKCSYRISIRSPNHSQTIAENSIR